MHYLLWQHGKTRTLTPPTGERSDLTRASTPIRILNIEYETERDLDADLDQQEEEEPRAKVLIHNDNVTPYDFVIVILQKIFQLTPMEAEHVTFVAHTTGVAYVATYPVSEAQRRVGKAHFAASLEGYPLTFSIEPE